MPDFQKYPGQWMYYLAEQLFGICRSLTGNGVRETLSIIQNTLPELEIHEVPSGSQCCDWLVPDDWNIQNAYILDTKGNKVIDFQKNNLHVMGYSDPIDQEMSLSELENYLFSIPKTGCYSLCYQLL